MLIPGLGQCTCVCSGGDVLYSIPQACNVM